MGGCRRVFLSRPSHFIFCLFFSFIQDKDIVKISFGDRMATWVCAENIHGLVMLTKETKLDNLSEFCFSMHTCLCFLFGGGLNLCVFWCLVAHTFPIS